MVHTFLSLRPSYPMAFNQLTKLIKTKFTDWLFYSLTSFSTRGNGLQERALRIRYFGRSSLHKEWAGCYALSTNRCLRTRLSNQYLIVWRRKLHCGGEIFWDKHDGNRYEKIGVVWYLELQRIHCSEIRYSSINTKVNRPCLVGVIYWFYIKKVLLMFHG